ncbi:hypothetical protein RJZ56_005352 [Blastomyces dermatitidis]|uniref:Uncharacterized protein n=4 Tax=Ajellomyces dermatitidis TaxID=5039 RepID=F2TDA7_AJEDA|nr:uncharacterized protein BDCG_07029 [Blastomyces dermatitidis ER-3]EEQ91909.1 hypothetical protein BDCG_07029 [Blastomyces dermatitidis ER-3]EGE81218.1 hypothetical protein BDDG_04159 [Blastomyces dermatitidis ATCC 18188]EQL34953.1 hypothetical protein BDFG_03382 [Blastomyces dermatitidis ATCC 26199]
MVVLSLLCPLMLLGLASAQIIKDPLVKNVLDFDSTFDASLPAPQKYTYKKWTTYEIEQGLPPDSTWTASYYEKESRHYCRADFSVYNVTYADCPEPWVIGHCAKAEISREATFDLLGRLPSSARGVISDLLNANIERGLSFRWHNKHSVMLGGYFRPADGLKAALAALWVGGPGVPYETFLNAVNADTCVADTRAAESLKRDGSLGDAVEKGFAVAAYLKLVKGTPPFDASCMSNQLKVLGAILDQRWDAPGQCPDKKAPELVKYRSVLFSAGIEVLNTDPVPGSRPAEVVYWPKFKGYPEFCWNEARAQRSNDDLRPRCEPRRLNVFNVTYEDCPDQDPWVICHCSDAQQSLDDVIRRVGQLPPGLRSHMIHLIAFEHSSVGGAAVLPWNMVMIFGEAQDSVYMHEASHCIDRGFYASETFRTAKAKDSCWPTHYSKSADIELFAEIGVLYLYDKSGKTLIQRGHDPACLANGLKAIDAYVGLDYQRGGSKCFKRKPNSKVVYPPGFQIQSPEPYISNAVIENFSNPGDVSSLSSLSSPASPWGDYPREIHGQ